MRTLMVASIVLLLAISGGDVSAQINTDAQWIWYDAGDPAQDAPAGKVWFRTEVRATEPSTCALWIACDDRFVVWVNGQRIGEGSGQRSFMFHPNGLIDRGTNVIAIEAANDGGRAGLLVEGEIRGQGGRAIACDSGPQWRATRTAPTGDAWRLPRFNAAGWEPVKTLGTHEQSPWREIRFGNAVSYLDRFQLTEGFQLQRIAEPDLVGSLVAITWGNRGRLIASRERGPVLSVIDDNADGKYDRVQEYSSAVTNAQGLLQVFDDLYVVGEGPSGTGMYQLPDRDRDDRADEVVLITKYQGNMGEHGPHAVVFGPDGWLYNNVGNHAWVTHTPQPTSPIRSYYEGDLLRPRMEDPGGHAAGIPAPGGTIWRLTPDGQKWWLQTNGFRNHYDFAINRDGEVFTFDSDMEWEVGMPFYKPVRVAHCIPGADFGWRSNAGKWPPHYFDSLPAAVDIGRGSPTGVVFYEHAQFPESYRGALLACDWSMGRIVAVHLKPDGATYTGSWETLISGNPLNVSDVEVDRDGSVVFSTGGRRTEGGIYRITYGAGRAAQSAPPAATLNDALAMPQMQTGWARELVGQIKQKLGDRWWPELAQAALEGTPEQQTRALTLLSQFGPSPSSELLIKLAANDDELVRATAAWLLGEHPQPAVAESLAGLLNDPSPRVQRRACEAFVRSGLEPPAASFIRLLGSEDRFVRFAARLALEHLPAEKWADEALSSSNPRVATHGMLAVLRAAPDRLPHQTAFEKQLALLNSAQPDRDDELIVETLRLVELTLIAGGKGPAAERIGQKLLTDFPRIAKSPEASRFADAINMEASRILAHLQVPGAADKLIAAMEQAPTKAMQIHFAFTLAYLHEGWTFDHKRRLLDWYQTAEHWEGGNSFPMWISNIVARSLANCTPEERKELLVDWSKRPYATKLVLRISQPEEISDYEQTMIRLLGDVEKQPVSAEREEMVAFVIEALGRSTAAQSQVLLRKLFEQYPDRREQLARKLAARPAPENWPYLVQSLRFGDSTTLQLCLRALRRIDRRPEKPDDIRAAILAGLKLGDQGGGGAVALLDQWTGVEPRGARGAAGAIAWYQTWFRDQYPSEPAAELPRSEAGKNKHSYRQLYDLLESRPNGDPQRGKLVFVKAGCVKCHRFEEEGQGVGPDLTTVRRRFQRKEIIESLLFPSQVISDQFRSVTVVTEDGLVHVGMPLPEAGFRSLVLLLPDSTRLEIPRREVAEQHPSTVSVMPEGLLNQLSDDEIVDLFAYLETSKSNETAATGK